jgi:hypothetical protein
MADPGKPAKLKKGKSFGIVAVDAINKSRAYPPRGAPQRQGVLHSLKLSSRRYADVLVR